MWLTRLFQLFQSTPPYGGRRSRSRSRSCRSGFNPRPRMGGDQRCKRQSNILAVSIHAPVWGATVLFLSFWRIAFGFNPRPRMGGDLRCVRRAAENVWVSIHAPVWGATAFLEVIVGVVEFQSTPPYGGRHSEPYGADGEAGVSIHAPVWGGDLAGRGQQQEPGSFNPRPRMGGDLRLRLPAHEQRVSIHAPVWGATGNPTVREPNAIVSIHAPVWGATPNRTPNSRTWTFQSTPPYGGRRHTDNGPKLYRCFNPRPRMGGD